MANISMEIKGLDQLMKAVKKAPKVVSGELNVGIKKATILLQGEARKEAPVKTGFLRNRITSQTMPLKGIIRSRAPYSIFVHEGTRPHIIEVRRKRVLSDGSNIFGTRVRHPGTKANPFMERAVKKGQNRVDRIFEMAMNNVVNKIVKL